MSQFRARPPAVPTTLVDDAVVRIIRWDFEPGADTGVHTHGLGYVVVPMTDCDFLIEEEDGTERRAKIEKGAAYRREAGTTHNVVNGGSAAMSFIEIEYK
ncbi:cupin domain-containing protein [Affinirhizobium pseudoryzae]|uniref:cupin n=1 Tax=Allorhizobium pseudoryzae TaxID=379684 RepID=UPI0013E9FCD1|nr:cupin [Allorhizobium pseudoryzae]